MHVVNQVAITLEQGSVRYFRNTRNTNKEEILYRVIMQNDGFVFVEEKPKSPVFEELEWRDTDSSLAHDFIFMCMKLEEEYAKI